MKSSNDHPDGGVPMWRTRTASRALAAIADAEIRKRVERHIGEALAVIANNPSSFLELLADGEFEIELDSSEGVELVLAKDRETIAEIAGGAAPVLERGDRRCYVATLHAGSDALEEPDPFATLVVMRTEDAEVVIPGLIVDQRVANRLRDTTAGREDRGQPR